MNVTECNGSGGPEVLRSASAPDPSVAPGVVIIDVMASGVNHADLLQRRGRYDPPVGAPRWPGLEVAGTVRAVGDGVTRWRVGDWVCALLQGGGYAEQAAVDESLVLPIPPGISPVEAAALVEAACTVASAFEQAGAGPGETLLVHGGLGGVGTIAIQVGAALGMRVLATAGGRARADRCVALGAEAAFDHRTDDWVAEVRSRGGADVILDVVGAAYLAKNLSALSTGGRLVVLGMQGGARGELDLGMLLAKRARVIGTTLRARPLSERAAIVALVERTVWPMVPDQVRPLVHATFPLAEAAAAHTMLEAGGVAGSLVLLP
ncbi:NAD(P)H-quinone oxidoreductase [Demequina capsici]|uniref:NAD(P)H-quinone oxidoreductase n=1 Tax=Demequina capsici TaxID=3075620 RepID=A0AA96FDB4_9MICO|nr:NAD(P)H-quinone oxidoreductase [Demequina sp. PMTSA13]WNM27499.1 NAD(P)H-quinone oxidoreductase [Demequina sp. PMTSA13]